MRPLLHPYHHVCSSVELPGLSHQTFHLVQDTSNQLVVYRRTQRALVSRRKFHQYLSDATPAVNHAGQYTTHYKFRVELVAHFTQVPAVSDIGHELTFEKEALLSDEGMDWHRGGGELTHQYRIFLKRLEVQT